MVDRSVQETGRAQRAACVHARLYSCRHDAPAGDPEPPDWGSYTRGAKLRTYCLDCGRFMGWLELAG